MTTAALLINKGAKVDYVNKVRLLYCRVSSLFKCTQFEGSMYTTYNVPAANSVAVIET